jgi:GDPmannose 4,6-dehydratase
MTSALITGITGQDGSYLAELLLEKGYRVIGTTRDVQKASRTVPLSLKNTIELVAWNMLDQDGIANIVSDYRPAEIYNCAAYSSGSGMYDNPVGIGDVNGLAVARILEAVRAVDQSIRFCQASSREIFGEADESPQSEKTLANPRSPYGAAKLYADNLIRMYRKRYGVFACSAILFNHESPRRGLEFVTRKVTHEAARIKLGQIKEIRLGNLNAQRDWGFAGDYVRAMWLMLQSTHAEDYVVAIGETHSVRELCEVAFRHLGLDYQNYVREESSAYRPIETVRLVGDSTKARKQLGWVPAVKFHELVGMMVDADVRLLATRR